MYNFGGAGAIGEIKDSRQRKFSVELAQRIRYVQTWVVVKMMVPFWIPSTIWHLIFRVPKKGP